MQSKVISLPKFFAELDIHGQTLPVCTKWPVVALKKWQKANEWNIPASSLVLVLFLSSALWLLYQKESDRYCKAEIHISESDCLHSGSVLIPGVEPKRLNF